VRDLRISPFMSGVDGRMETDVYWRLYRCLAEMPVWLCGDVHGALLAQLHHADRAAQLRKERAA
jgi:hypothetical protein